MADVFEDIDALKSQLVVFKSVSAANPALTAAIDIAQKAVAYAEDQIEKAECRRDMAESTLTKVREHMDLFQKRAETAEAECLSAVAALKHMVHLRKKENIAKARKEAAKFISKSEFAAIQRDIREILTTRNAEMVALRANLEKSFLASSLVIERNTGKSAVEKRADTPGDAWAIMNPHTGEAIEEFATRSEALKSFHQNFVYLQRAWDRWEATQKEVFRPRDVEKDWKRPTGEGSRGGVSGDEDEEEQRKDSIVPGMSNTSHPHDELEDPLHEQRNRNRVVQPELD